MTNVPIVIRKWVCLTIYLFQAPIFAGAGTNSPARLPVCRLGLFF
jgi:hypothetical protein